jgi:hypothetical protein
MNIFREGNNLLIASNCSECLVVAFGEHYSVVWTKKVMNKRKSIHIFKGGVAQFEVQHSESICMWIRNILRLCQTGFSNFDIVKWNKM